MVAFEDAASVIGALVVDHLLLSLWQARSRCRWRGGENASAEDSSDAIEAITVNSAIGKGERIISS